MYPFWNLITHTKAIRLRMLRSTMSCKYMISPWWYTLSTTLLYNSLQLKCDCIVLLDEQWEGLSLTSSSFHCSQQCWDAYSQQEWLSPAEWCWNPQLKERGRERETGREREKEREGERGSEREGGREGEREGGDRTRKREEGGEGRERERMR